MSVVNQAGEKNKNIIICCDGTSNKFGKNNTNVAKLYELIPADNNQVTFYDPGVGTSSTSVIPLLRKASNGLSKAFGLDLPKNVQDAYLYLMSCYEPGDKIFLFGFSRGAHTVRRLADILCKFGLLYKGSENMVSHVLDMNETGEEEEVIRAFRNRFTQTSPVHFLGVWDTVSALTKLMRPPTLDGVLHREIKTACHAVAIDELRVKFPANTFKETPFPDQSVQEVWFAGVHSDVGGSYEKCGLANISLLWMLKNATAHGLIVDESGLKKINGDPLGEQHNSWQGMFYFLPWPTYVLMITAIMFMLNWHLWPYCLLGLALAVLLVPTTKKMRTLPPNAKIHTSVKARLDKGKYRPANLLSVLKSKEITWVD